MISAGVVEVDSILGAEGVAVEGLISLDAGPEERCAVLVLLGGYFGGGGRVALGRPRGTLGVWEEVEGGRKGGVVRRSGERCDRAERGWRVGRVVGGVASGQTREGRVVARCQTLGHEGRA